jgi:hypothetical protein
VQIAFLTLWGRIEGIGLICYERSFVSLVLALVANAFKALRLLSIKQYLQANTLRSRVLRERGPRCTEKCTWPHSLWRQWSPSRRSRWVP